MTTEAEPQGTFNSKTLFIWGIVIALLLVLGLGLRETNQVQPTPGNPAPELALSFFEGYEFNGQREGALSDLQGEIVVLNFWASWCAPCRQEAAELEAVSREYADRGVTFLGIAWTDIDRNALAYLEEYDITYPNAPDIGLDAQELYHFKQVPETFFIDVNGTIQHFHSGPITAEQLRVYLDQMIGG
ncbi:MAG: TlpA family protein disulfide reductase [Candidatus Promineifilaceae bacterium]